MPVNNADRNLEDRALASQNRWPSVPLIDAVSWSPRSRQRSTRMYFIEEPQSAVHYTASWFPMACIHSPAIGLQRASTRVLVTFYFRLLISISGCSFFSLSVDKLLEFMETWGSAISFATCQHGNRAKYRPPIHACLRHWPFGPRVHWPTTRSSS